MRVTQWNSALNSSYAQIRRDAGTEPHDHPQLVGLHPIARLERANVRLPVQDASIPIGEIVAHVGMTGASLGTGGAPAR